MISVNVYIVVKHYLIGGKVIFKTMCRVIYLDQRSVKQGNEDIMRNSTLLFHVALLQQTCSESCTEFWLINNLVSNHSKDPDWYFYNESDEGGIDDLNLIKLVQNIVHSQNSLWVMLILVRPRIHPK
jgi:hypothetical protein